MKTVQTIKAAILGAGGMGRCHGENLSKTSGVTVAAICDASKAQAENLANQLGATAYDNFTEMLDAETPDVLYICLPPFAHTGQFEEASKRGIHIFIEKPIAITSARGESMVSAAKAADIHTHVGFHMRHGSAVAKLKEMIQSGETGRPVLFEGIYRCNSLHTPWWIDVTKCGGQIFEQAIHVYDMCRYLLGNPKSAMGIMGNVVHAAVPGYTVEDVSSSIASFTSGAIAAITANNCSVPDKWEALFNVTFEKLTVRFTDPDTATFFQTAEGKSFEVANPVDHKRIETESFINLVKNGGKPLCPVEEGLRSLYFVEAVVQSASLDGQKIIVKS